ncbi:hypothetical protein SERLADRAFT_462976, partial [Serpula lacrymans var. lacrymans S7.9]
MALSYSLTTPIKPGVSSPSPRRSFYKKPPLTASFLSSAYLHHGPAPPLKLKTV